MRQIFEVRNIDITLDYIYICISTASNICLEGVLGLLTKLAF
jgi:hypothetical protein